MRSLLFVPGDSEKKLAKSLGSGADALVLDLEDSVVAERKPEARKISRDFLSSRSGSTKLFVRVNPLSSGMILDDLAAIVGGRPDGIVLPKAEGGDDIRKVDHDLAALEAREGLPVGGIAILPIVTETAAAMFALGTYAGSSPRLCGMTWGCEDLAAAVGAAENRRPDNSYLPPFELARSLCLFGAAAAGVAAIDTVFTDFRDDAGLDREARAAERVGFTGKVAIHPAQIATINRAFTPDAAAVAWARKVVDAFAANPSAGTVGLEGKMLDRPHLRTAQRVLERAEAAG
ncbi:MAG: CoA ester lyase [Alphaproteobacteria bacterium]|nr:CoA ester lyase [Alphaproteobacteria bacterium]